MILDFGKIRCFSEREMDFVENTQDKLSDKKSQKKKITDNYKGLSEFAFDRPENINNSLNRI